MILADDGGADEPPPEQRKRKSAGGRNDQVARVLRVLFMLQRGGQDLYELAEANGVNTRTIRRDLDAIQQSGIPLKAEQGEGSRKRWVIDFKAMDRLSGLFQASHYLALKLAMEEASFVRHTDGLLANLQEVSDEIERALGQKGRRTLADLERCITTWDKFALRRAPQDRFWPLVEAIAARQVCEVTYRAPSSGNRVKTYEVLPLRLLVHQGSVYLHAWHEGFKNVLALNLHRLEGLQRLDRTAPLPEGYDPERLESSAFGIFIGGSPQRFVLHFDAFARPYIEERTWHPTEELEPRPDGSLVLRFTCTPSYEVTNWVASWREHVKVLEPRMLVEELATYGRWLGKHYST